MESNTINIWCKDSFYISFLRKYINKLKHISQCFYFGSKLVVLISTQLSKLILKNQGPIPFLSSTKDVQNVIFYFVSYFEIFRKDVRVRRHRSNCCFLRLHGISHFNCLHHQRNHDADSVNDKRSFRN